MQVIKKEVFIKELNRQALLYVGLPDDYDKSDDHYPVLYMHDGHNVFFEEDSFSGVTWGVLEAYKNDPTLPKIIIVGLECAPGIERLNEYGPFPFEIDLSHEFDTIPGGKGDLYLNYLVENLKPEIDATYRTKKEAIYTGIMGSSMGGVISLHAACHYSHVFSRIGSVSGAFYVSFNAIKESVLKADFSPIEKLYMDTGDDEIGEGEYSDYVLANTIIYELLTKKLSQKHLYYRIIAGGKHHESDWAKRLPDILRYLFS